MTVPIVFKHMEYIKFWRFGGTAKVSIRDT